jgi:hypothetical protein
VHPGETFIWAAEVFIPRAIFGSKEDPGKFGNYFGRQYGMVYSQDKITAIAVTQPGEQYLNFGLIGILFCAPLVGGVYRAISVYFARRRNDPATLALYAGLAWPLVNGHETILAMGLFGVLKVTALYVVLLVLIGRMRSLAAPRGSYAASAPEILA